MVSYQTLLLIWSKTQNQITHTNSKSKEQSFYTGSIPNSDIYIQLLVMYQLHQESEKPQAKSDCKHTKKTHLSLTTLFPVHIVYTRVFLNKSNRE